MLSGAESARFTRAIRIGRRYPEAMWSISHIRARPCAEVAVATRPPAAEAPMQALIALCSLSTRIVSVSTLPSDTNLVNDSMMPVEGVMGYAGITSGFSWRKASATAWLPVTATVLIDVIAMLFALLFHDDGLVALFPGALHGADAAALAVV